MGYHHWTGVLRGLVRSLRGLEAAGLISYDKTQQGAGRLRRTIRLTDEGRNVVGRLLHVNIEEVR